MKLLRIIVDFEKTFTLDPSMWMQFIRVANFHGHRVYVITNCREAEGQDVRNAVHPVGRYLCDILYAGVKSKRLYLAARGMKFDVLV